MSESWKRVRSHAELLKYSVDNGHRIEVRHTLPKKWFRAQKSVWHVIRNPEELASATRRLSNAFENGKVEVRPLIEKDN